MANTYGIKHKETGLFFTGFDSKNAPSWGAEEDAKRFDKSSATGQALLFARFGIKVQQKPVSL